MSPSSEPGKSWARGRGRSVTSLPRSLGRRAGTVGGLLQGSRAMKVSGWGPGGTHKTLSYTGCSAEASGRPHSAWGLKVRGKLWQQQCKGPGAGTSLGGSQGSSAGGWGASVPDSHNPVRRRGAPSLLGQSPLQAHQGLGPQEQLPETKPAKRLPSVTPERSCGVGVSRELRRLQGNGGLSLAGSPPPPVPLPAPPAHMSCRHTDSSVPRQAGF